MRLTEKVERTVEETTDVLCNRCGESCKVGDHFLGLIETTVQGQIVSHHLALKTYTFSLCEKCLAELFSYFQLSPVVESPTID